MTQEFFTKRRGEKVATAVQNGSTLQWTGKEENRNARHKRETIK